MSDKCPHCLTPYIGELDDKGQPICECDGAEIQRLNAELEAVKDERDKYEAALKAIAIGMLLPKEFAKAALDGRWKPIFEKGGEK